MKGLVLTSFLGVEVEAGDMRFLLQYEDTVVCGLRLGETFEQLKGFMSQRKKAYGTMFPAFLSMHPLLEGNQLASAEQKEIVLQLISQYPESFLMDAPTAKVKTVKRTTLEPGEFVESRFWDGKVATQLKEMLTDMSTRPEVNETLLTMTQEMYAESEEYSRRAFVYGELKTLLAPIMVKVPHALHGQILRRVMDRVSEIPKLFWWDAAKLFALVLSCSYKCWLARSCGTRWAIPPVQECVE